MSFPTLTFYDSYITVIWALLASWKHLGFLHVFFQKEKCMSSSGEKYLEEARLSIAAGPLKGNISCVIHLFWRQQIALTGTVRLTIWEQCISIGLWKWSCFMNISQILPTRGWMSRKQIVHLFLQIEKLRHGGEGAPFQDNSGMWWSLPKIINNS